MRTVKDEAAGMFITNITANSIRNVWNRLQYLSDTLTNIATTAGNQNVYIIFQKVYVLKWYPPLKN